ncbi:hypothetical protein [Paramaledivibacter caminithermalis]|jgi:hypothetical protein|uniref:Uncharacterized protein n=1 Tax=Paramaledivibacter caminithermalis (strain DSM 15212 / CIP 107654 / DViRD3) TaxID=1121301 RepID=A0A1M6KHZ5_PARC5|nr:hypothetical protein [Paramaledivibacter caminithermalis]SHJ58576.1 hypothetical protein SAMN02745912_00409 [Paramaledivibacter caminithermalis DSM 15212]
MRKDMNKEKFNRIKDSVDQLKETYKGKTQDDLIDEVKKIRANMSDAEFRRQIAAMNRIRGFLTESQQKKLDRLIEMLEKN